MKNIINSASKEFLKDVPQELINRATLVHYGAKKTILKKSEKTEYAYILLEGELSVINEFEDGKYYTFSSLKPFTYLSDLECLSGEMKNAATVVTCEDSTLLRCNIEDFVYYLKKDHQFLMSVASALSRKIYFTSYERGKNLYKPGIDKLIHYIVTYYQNSRNNKDTNLIINKTRGMIASEIGVSIKTVDRSVYKLKSRGLIELTKGKINVNGEQYNALAKLNKIKY